MANTKKLKILLVEDDPLLGELFQGRLVKEGYDVTRADVGEDVVKLLKNMQPDLILLDLCLPKESGFGIMQEINSRTDIHKAPIIVISNLDQPSDVQRAKELGAKEYFVKTKIRHTELLDKIRDFILGEEVPE